LGVRTRRVTALSQRTVTVYPKATPKPLKGFCVALGICTQVLHRAFRLRAQDAGDLISLFATIIEDFLVPKYTNYISQRALKSLTLALSVLVMTAWLPRYGLGQSSMGEKPTYSSSSDGSFNFESLRKLIEDKNIKSIEALLTMLPEDIRSNYTLVYDSRSIQGASFSNPRAILYDKKSGLMIAFNGAPDQVGHNNLEVIQYRKDSRTFEFREIVFPDSQDSSAKAEFSHKNPQSCLACHGGDDPRPNWDPYSFWPGTYLGLDDGLHGYQVGEKEGLEKFLSNANSHDRYRHLVGLAEGYQLTSPRKEGYSSRTKGMHGSHFTHFIGDSNIKRIVRKFQEHPNYAAYKYAVLWMAHCTEQYRQPVASVLPPGNPLELLKVSLPKPDSKDWWEDYEFVRGQLAANTRDYKGRSEMLSRISMPEFIALLEHVGLDAKNLSMAFKRDYSAFDLPQHFFRQLTAELILQDPDLRAFDIEVKTEMFLGVLTSNAKLPRKERDIDRDRYDKQCSQIKERSLNALSSISPTTPVRTAATAEAIELCPTNFTADEKSLVRAQIKSCMSCHTATSEELNFGFNIPLDLRAALEVPSKIENDKRLHQVIESRILSETKDYKMPPNKQLDDLTKKLLLRYFKWCREAGLNRSPHEESNATHQ
jgi:hypothetical protein